MNSAGADDEDNQRWKLRGEWLDSPMEILFFYELIYVKSLFQIQFIFAEDSSWKIWWNSEYKKYTET